MTGFDDEKPKKRVAHEIGSDITLLSADELTARIALLEAEIERLKTERTAKGAGRLAAENLFKK